MSCILIIEDDKGVRTVLQEMLQAAGYEVVHATNGKQGLRVYAEHSVDLVITDLLMPIMPGSRFISILKNEFPNQKIIAMSGGGMRYQSDSYLELASDLGAERILKKPFLQAELMNVVEEALAEQKAA